MLNELKIAIGALRKIGAKKEVESFEELLAEEIRKLNEKEGRENKPVQEKSSNGAFKVKQDLNDLLHILLTRESEEDENPEDND